MNENPITGLIIITIVLVIYFLPSFVAGARYHPNRIPILLLNLFLGWTFIGWVIALIWSSLNFEPD